MQLVIECMLDIGDVIISGYDFKKPASYREVIKVLAENKVIKSNLDELQDLASFRKIVHDYLELDRKIIYL